MPSLSSLDRAGRGARAARTRSFRLLRTAAAMAGQKIAQRNQRSDMLDSAGQDTFFLSCPAPDIMDTPLRGVFLSGAASSLRLSNRQLREWCRRGRSAPLRLI